MRKPPGDHADEHGYDDGEGDDGDDGDDDDYDVFKCILYLQSG